jgi:hypothetical protein
LEHVPICNRCKDFYIDACVNHASTLLLSNDFGSVISEIQLWLMAHFVIKCFG